MAPKKTIPEPAKPRLGIARQRPEGFFSQSMPLYIGILLLVLGLILGTGIGMILFKEKTTPPDNNPPDTNAQKTPIAITVYTSDKCPFCNDPTSLELLLQKRGIPFTRTDKPIEKPANRAEFDSLKIQTIPVSVVNESDLKKTDPTLYTNLAGEYPPKKGKLVFEELQLIRQTLPDYPVAFMKIELLPAAICTTGSKPSVIEFADFFCQDCYDALGPISQIQTKFGSSIDYDFRPVSQLGDQNDSEMANNSVECARDQNTLDQYKKSLFEEWFSLNYPIWQEERQLIVAQKAKIPDLNAFSDCIETKPHLDKVLKQTGTNYAPLAAFNSSRLPAYLIDCQYLLIKPNKLETALCSLHPELAACDTA